ncbi:Ig-like domain-containing protein [Actinoplanes sp. CA-252034]|uniref:Ig-like domain-containing protein n=1 Tax=Actinoplanes sp. CA-252034 TaxID=3239906 RepID=UPI003D957423
MASAAAITTTILLGHGIPARADDPLPVLSSTGLTEGQPLGPFTRFKPVFSDDVDRVAVLINGAGKSESAETARSSGITAYLGSTVADDADVDVTVRACVIGGSCAEATTRVHTDLTAPTATISPSEGIVSGTVTIAASDVSADTAQIRLTLGQSTLDTVTAAPWQLTWDTVKNPGQALWVRIRDTANNERIYRPQYVVDNAGPPVHIGWPDLPWELRGGWNRLSGGFGDADRVEWWVDGAVRSTGRDLDYDFGDRSRETFLEVRAWDAQGNLSVNKGWMSIDADAPAVVSATPANGALVRGRSVTTTLVLKDSTKIETVIPVNGSLTVRGSSYIGRFPLRRDGRQVLVWNVVDSWGNRRDVYRTVTVDNTKPALAVTKAPKNGARVKGAVRVAASAKDRNGVAKVQLLINGRVVATDTKAAYSFAIDTRKYGKKIKVQLRAYDRAGNVTVTSVRTWRR